MENHIYKAILQKFSFNFREYYSPRPKTQTGLRKIIFKIHLILKLSLQCQSIEILLRVFFPPFFFSLVHTIIYIYIYINRLSNNQNDRQFEIRPSFNFEINLDRFEVSIEEKKKQNKQRIRREEKYRITANIYFVSIFHISGCLKKCGNLMNYRGMLDRRREPLSLSLFLYRERENRLTKVILIGYGIFNLRINSANFNLISFFLSFSGQIVSF